MPCDKDFGYVTLTQGLTWERYGDLWQLTYVTMSETTPEDHLIILRELLVDNKTLAMSSSIWARVNGSRARVNCLRTNVKLHLSCTVVGWFFKSGISTIPAAGFASAFNTGTIAIANYNVQITQSIWYIAHIAIPLIPR